MKKLITLIAMFLMLTGKANAGIEEYSNIITPFKNGDIDITYIPILHKTDYAIEKESQEKILNYLNKEMQKAYRLMEGNASLENKTISFSMDYIVNILVNKIPIVFPKFELAEIHDYGDDFSTIYKPSPHGGQQLLFVTIIIQRHWHNSSLFVISSLTYYDDNSFKSMGNSIVNRILYLANKDYPELKK